MRGVNSCFARYIIYFILFWCSDSFALQADSNLPQWKKLLHYSGEQSIVVSDSFFLHPNGNIDYVKELKLSIKLLNSDNGKLIACNFPARYLWIKNHQYSVPSFVLETCTELNKYVANFQKDSIHIVFASEHIDSPSSVFGHILLLFKDSDKPLLSADVVYFTADTNGDDVFLRYAYKGMSGGYSGYYFRAPFYKINFTYSMLEQRTINILRLNMNKEQILFLIYHLYELRKAEFRYFFLKENCAYQIDYLLGLAYETDSGNYDNSMYVLPLDVVNSYSNKIIDGFKIDPSLIRAEHLFEQMAPADKEKYLYAKENSESINDSLPGNVKGVLFIEYEYNFRRLGIVLPEYNRVERLTFDNGFKQSAVSLESFYKSGKQASIGYYNSNHLQGLYLKFRPIGRSLFQNQLERLQESSVALFDIQLVVKEKSNIYIYRLDIISASSLFDRSRIASKTSWAFNFGVNRQNTSGEAIFDLSAGLGQSYSISRNLGLWYLVEFGVQESNDDGSMYLKPSANMVYYLEKNTKIGFRVLIKSLLRKTYRENMLFMSREFRHLSVWLRFFTTNSSNGEKTIISINKTF